MNHSTFFSKVVFYLLFFCHTVNALSASASTGLVLAALLMANYVTSQNSCLCNAPRAASQHHSQKHQQLCIHDNNDSKCHQTQNQSTAGGPSISVSLSMTSSPIYPWVMPIFCLAEGAMVKYRSPCHNTLDFFKGIL